MIRSTSIAAIFTALLYLSVPSQAALVGFWDFEEGSGTTTADQSGGGNTGTLGTGAIWSSTEFAPGPSGSTASINFDGTDFANVIMSGYRAPEIGGTNSRTLAAWIKSDPSVTPVTSNMAIFAYGDDATGQKWIFRTQHGNGTSGAIRVEVNGGYIVGSNVVIDNTWHHVAMTWEDDGTPDVQDVRLYVDGVLDATSASLSEPVNTDTSVAEGLELTIGDDHSNREWNGWLDDLRIYDEALSQSAIFALAVPEPSSTLLLVLGGLAFVLRRRR